MLGLFLDIEIKPRGEPHGPQQAQVVFIESLVGDTNRTDHFRRQVHPPTDVVDDLVCYRVQKQPVDGEIPALCVFFGGGEADFRRTSAVVIRPVGSKGGHLYHALTKPHENDSERRADRLGVMKEFPHPFGDGIGGDVVIIRLVSHQQIADASTGEIGDVPGRAEVGHDRHCVLPVAGRLGACRWSGG